jgi:hypothetical protein
MMKKLSYMAGKQSLGHLLLIGTLSLGLVTMTNIARAAGAPAKESQNPVSDTTALAKESQNPISTLISLPFENNSTFNNGPDNDYTNILNIKPVIPMSLTENWNWINRVIAPVIYDDQDIPGDSANFGIGDIVYQGFLSPAKTGEIIWGFGPQINLPTGMDRFTSDQWSIGPNAVVLTMPGKWVIGALVGNVWSVGGYNDAKHVSQLTTQPFINYNMEDGWYLSSSPVITANWKADDNDDTWTVPVGGGVGRVFKIGNQHINAKFAVYNSVVRPDDASDWNVQLTCIFMFPKGK